GRQETGVVNRAVRRAMQRQIKTRAHTSSSSTSQLHVGQATAATPVASMKTTTDFTRRKLTAPARGRNGVRVNAGKQVSLVQLQPVSDSFVSRRPVKGPLAARSPRKRNAAITNAATCNNAGPGTSRKTVVRGRQIAR